VDILSINSSPAKSEELQSGPYWGELRVFIEVARARSFNTAAKRLNLSHPTVARKVRRLERQMGVQLVVSTERGVQLTKRGQELARALANLDQFLYAITSGLHEEDRHAEAIVRVSITDGLNALFAAPQMEVFSQKNPNIHLHMKSMINLNDVRENQTDMMLAFAPDSRADVVVRRLGSLHFQPIASKRYVDKYGLPTKGNIGDHKFLQSHFYESNAELWAGWQRLVAKGRISHYCDDTFVYGIMVRLGLGIGLLGTYTTAAPDAVPLDLDVVISLPLYIIALEQRLRSRPVKLVFDWVCEVFSEKNPWFPHEFKVQDAPPALDALKLLLGGPLGLGNSDLA
jgi:DNA-binding transcriptional LysR family regulator